jgi:HEAT repeat protein
MYPFILSIASLIAVFYGTRLCGRLRKGSRITWIGDRSVFRRTPWDRFKYALAVELVLFGVIAFVASIVWLRFWWLGPFRTESNPVVRVETARHFGEARDRSSLRYMLPAFAADSDPRVRAAIACALGQIGDERGLPPLVQKVDQANDEKDVMICALRSIREFGLSTPVPVLIGAMQKTSGATRQEVIATLGSLHDPRALEPLLLVAMKEDADEDAACKAVAALGDQALPSVRQAYAKGYELPAINIMRYMGDAAADDLIAAFRTGSPAIRKQAERAILLSEGTRGVTAMRASMSTNLRLVAEAHVDLIELGDDSFVPLLVRALDSYGNENMATTYLNCGKPELESAGKHWAKLHGYEVWPFGGSGGPTWGRH